jgi:hypothetical protein
MMLAVANPALSGQQSAGSVLARAFAGCRGGGPVDPQLLRSLVALPDTGQEVRDAAAAIGAVDATLLMGEGASETALRKASPGDYRILYFATHGLIPGELQCQNEPGLVEGADEVFAFRGIDAGFSTDGAVHEGDDGGGDLDEGDAPVKNGGSKPGQVPHDATPQGDEEGLTSQPGADHLAGDGFHFGVALRLFPGRHGDHGGFNAGLAQGMGGGCRVERADLGIGDEGAGFGRREKGPGFRSDGGEQARGDFHLVGGQGQGNGNREHGPD